MATTTKTVSARFPAALLEEALQLCPSAKVSEMLLEAFVAWLKEKRRRHEDEVIRAALASVSPQQRQEEREVVGMAGRSALRVVEKADG